MRAAAAAGALCRAGQSPRSTNAPEQFGFLLPALVVKVQGQKPTGIIRKDRIDADDISAEQIVPAQMAINHLV